MNEKENVEAKQEITHETHKKQIPRYSHENKKEHQKQNESQTMRWPTGKKQRQQRKR